MRAWRSRERTASTAASGTHEQADHRADRDRRDGGEQADRGEGAVEGVDRRHQPQALASRGAVDQAGAERGRGEVEGELGAERHHVERPVVPGEDLSAGEDQHQRGTDSVPAVAEDVEGPVDAGRARGVVEQPAEHPADADDERDDRRRQQEEHRHEDQLGRDRVAVGDFELRPAGDHVRGDQQEERFDFERAGGGDEQGHRQGDGEERDRHRRFDRALASAGALFRARATDREKAFQLWCLGDAGHWRRGPASASAAHIYRQVATTA